MAEAGDLLSGLDAIVDQVGEGEQRLRAYLGNLSERLARICSRSGIYCAGDTVTLEECGDGESVFGYLFCDKDGLSLGSAFTGDVTVLMPGEEVSYSVSAAKDCPEAWLRAISERQVIEGLLGKLQEALLARNEELGKKIGAIDKLMLPPSAVAAAGFEKVAEDLGFGEIVADWRKAQVKAVTEPETAIRMACVIVESVCKHIIDDSGEAHDPKADLQGLFKKTRAILKLDPADGAIPESVRNICGGLITLTQNIGAFRNYSSDAHGKGPGRAAVTTSYANLAVNGAGALATFLLERWKSAKVRA